MRGNLSNAEEEDSRSRRTVLKSLGAGGVGFVALNSVPRVVGGQGGTVEVVTHMEGDCVARTRDVPRKWYKHTRKTRRANDTLTQQLTRNDDVWMVSTGRGKDRMGGFETHRLIVSITPAGNTDDIPDDIDGIPVEIRRRSKPRPLACYKKKYSKLKGGIWMSVPKYASEGSLFGRVKDYRNGEWQTYLLGARHVFLSGDLCSTEDPTGYSWQQETLAGKVVDHFPNHDCVLLDDSKTSRDIANTVVDEDGYLAGRITENGLECLKSTDKLVQKRGITTCASSGYVDEIKGTTVCANFWITGIVKTDMNSEPGDSGGPVYHEVYDSPDRLYAVNITTHGYDNNNVTLGSSAENMNKRQNFWFGGDPYNPCA